MTHKFSLPVGEETFTCERCQKPYLLITETTKMTTVYSYNPSPAMWLYSEPREGAMPEVEIKCQHCSATGDDTGWRVDEDEYGDKITAPVGVNVASWANQTLFPYQDLRRAYHSLNIPRTLLPGTEAWEIGVEGEMMVARLGLLYETPGDIKRNPTKQMLLQQQLLDQLRRLPSFQVKYCHVLTESIDDHYNPMGVVAEAQVGLRWQYSDEQTERESVAEYWKDLFLSLSVHGRRSILPITCSPTAMMYFVTVRFGTGDESEADVVDILRREGLFPIERMPKHALENREWHVWCIKREAHGEAIKLMLNLAGIAATDLMAFGEVGQPVEWQLMLPSSLNIAANGMNAVKNKIRIALKGAAQNLYTQAEEIGGKWYTRTLFQFDPSRIVSGVPK